VLCCIAAADAGDWLAKEGSCSHACAIAMMAMFRLIVLQLSAIGLFCNTAADAG
jgi:hypothetical protein